MNWPGVARWAALALFAMLIVLIATSEVIARRGWWAFTTELVVPVFLGVAGAAVAVVATIVSHRSVEVARRAGELEAARAERARRQPLARDAIDLLTTAISMYDAREGGRRAKVGTRVGTLERELGLHDGSEALLDLVKRFAIALEVRQAKPGADATTVQVAYLQRTKWIRLSRHAINAWAQNPEDDGQAMKDLVIMFPRGVVGEK